MRSKQIYYVLKKVIHALIWRNYSRNTDMNILIWIINIIIAFLAAFSALCWGNVIKEVGAPNFTLRFLLTLVLNKYYIMAMASALMASMIRYTVLKEMGVLLGGFFLSLSTVATILTCVFILGEKITPRSWVGIALIMIGIILVGRQ